MTHKVCHDIGSYVDQNIQQSLEQCVEQDCDWWCLCCNKWFCFIVWVIVTVVTWVVQTVCEIVADVIDVVVRIVTGIWDILAGIFTWDWTRVLAGLLEIVGSGLALVAELIPIATGGTLVGAFNTARNGWSLRDYVRDKVDAKYGATHPATAGAIKDALGIDKGFFGLRLQAVALRTFIRSDFSSQHDGTPDLIAWVREGLDPNLLKTIAGFNPPAWWNRTWPELVGDSGDISDVDFDNYIAKNGRGDDVKQFTLFCMSNTDLQTRLDAATEHATELGLILQWTINDVRLTQRTEVLMVPDSTNFPPLLALPPFSRHTSGDKAAAQADLCTPMVAGIFGFTDMSFTGYSAHLAAATCLEAVLPEGSTALPADGITGAAFWARKPEIAYKYTAIHELGHTFGLCHVDGLLRIMFSPKGKSYFSGSSLYQYWTSGLEAGFVLDEAKTAWDYIIENFSPECLTSRPF